MIVTANQFEVAVHCAGEGEVMIRFWMIRRRLEIIPIAIATGQKSRVSF